MALTIVACDLTLAGQNHRDLIDHIEAYPRHWRAQQFLWIVDSTKSEYEIAGELEPYLGNGDRLFVSRASVTSAGAGYSAQDAEWFRGNSG